MTNRLRNTITRREALTAGVATLGGAALTTSLHPIRNVGPAAPKRVLVLVQMYGGNDPLNTVVPLGNDAYLAARPEIHVTSEEALPSTTRTA